MTPQQVIRRYLWIAGLHTLAASLVWGVNTLFLLAAGLDILEVFLVNAAYTAAIVVFEIPTGAVADACGRRLSFLLSLVTLLLGTVVYIVAAARGGGLATFCAGALILGLGATFYSGAFEAWLVDALRAAGHRGALDRVLARGQLVTSATTVAGTLVGGFLASLHLSYPYLLRAALLLPLFALAALAMREPGFAPRQLRWQTLHRELEAIARASVAHGLGRPAVRALLIVGFLHYGFLTWAFHAWQPYFLELLGRDAPWVAGVVAALITLATMAGNALVVWLGPSPTAVLPEGGKRKAARKRRNLLLTAAAVQTAAAVAVGLAGSFSLAVGFFLLTAAAAGVVAPLKQAALHRLIPSGERATILSLDSLLSNLGGIGGQTGLGYLARQQGIAAGYVAGGLATALALPVLLRTRLKSSNPIALRDRSS